MPECDQAARESSTEEATVVPMPPRYWWLKRIGVAVGLLLVTLFALRLWWGWEANRRLQAEIDKIIAAGEPIYPEDFDPKEDIPDDQNAARLLIGADEAINLTSEQQELLHKVTGEPELIQARLDEVRAIMESNSEVFRRLRRARGLGRTDWGMRFRTPVINNSIPSYDGQRQLCRLMDVSALYHHGTGNDDEAVEIIRDALAHAENLSQEQMLISQLLAWACELLMIQAIENTLPSFSITSKNENPAQEGGAARHAQVRGLIAELLDERGARAGMRRATMYERMYQVDIHKVFVRGSTTMSAMFGWGGGSPLSALEAMWQHVLLPALTLDIVGALRRTTALVEAAGASSFLDVPTGGYDSATQSGFQSLLHPLQGYLYWSFERAFDQFFRMLATRRLAATALAIRLYEVDHGHRPETLAELVPEYLPQIPEDPFAKNRLTIRYLPHAAHPLVYSIGENGLDEEGKVQRQLGAGDFVFFLDGWRPEDNADDKVSPTSPQAGEHDDDVKDDEGQPDENGEGEEEP